MAHKYESGRRHVSDAIKINAERGRIYSAVTGGRSRSLTRLLIALERLTLVPLAIFDWWGKKYNRQGIHIIEADFVSMSEINEPSAPLRFGGQAGEHHLRSLGRQIKAYNKKVLRGAVRGDFHGVSALTFECLQFVHGLEEESQSLFPMTRHMLESIGMAACNAITYAEQSGGRTVLLSKAFVLFQILGLGASVGIDKKSQGCHALGAGIIENDVPDIPFEEAWRAHLSGQGSNADFSENPGHVHRLPTTTKHK